MVHSIGIDAADVERCGKFVTMPAAQLMRIFSHEEIVHCLSVPVKAAERFAARFAAKEAFYKAVHVVIADKRIPFFTLCSHVAVAHLGNGAPYLQVDWEFFASYGLPPSLAVHLSITHTKTTATALVLLEGPVLLVESLD